MIKDAHTLRERLSFGEITLAFERMVSIDWSMKRLTPSESQLQIETKVFESARKLKGEKRLIFANGANTVHVFPAGDFDCTNKRELKNLANALKQEEFETFEDFAAARFKVNNYFF